MLSDSSPKLRISGNESWSQDCHGSAIIIQRKELHLAGSSLMRWKRTRKTSSRELLLRAEVTSPPMIMRTVLLVSLLLLIIRGTEGWGVMRLKLGYDETMKGLREVNPEDLDGSVRRSVLKYGHNVSRLMEKEAGVSVQLVGTPSLVMPTAENLNEYYELIVKEIKKKNIAFEFMIFLTMFPDEDHQILDGGGEACKDWVLLSIMKPGSVIHDSESEVVRSIVTILMRLLGITPENKVCPANATTLIPACARDYIRAHEPKCMKGPAVETETVRGGEVCGNGIQEKDELCDCKAENRTCTHCCDMSQCLPNYRNCDSSGRRMTLPSSENPTTKQMNGGTPSRQSSSLSQVTIIIISVSVLLVIAIVVIVICVVKKLHLFGSDLSARSDRASDMIKTPTGRVQPLPSYDPDAGKPPTPKPKAPKRKQSLTSDTPKTKSAK